MNSQSLTFVLFGATGNLAQKKIIPALCALYRDRRLPEKFVLVAFSRRDWHDAQYRAFIKPVLEANRFASDIIDKFLNQIVYVRGTFDELSAYRALAVNLDRIDSSTGEPAQRIFHLAIQPEFHGLVFQGLGAAGLHTPLGQAPLPRLVIEKPFGHDLASAEALEKILERNFTEDQVYRIDHYLGKEGLRAVLENKKAGELAAVSARILETIDIESRGEFYDQTGALRDVGQNHALQMIAVAALGMPAPKSPEALARARTDVLRALQPGESVARAQYEGYRSEPAINPNSETETYFKITTKLNGIGLRDVLVTLEAGKALSQKKTDITLTFKDGTKQIFDVQKSCFGRDAYEILIEEAIAGDKTWFVSIDEVLASWKFVTPILEKFKNVPLKMYKKNIRYENHH